VMGRAASSSWRALPARGKARFLGMTPRAGHCLKMIETGLFDVIMQPVNLGFAGAPAGATVPGLRQPRIAFGDEGVQGGEYVTREKPLSP